MTKGYYLNVQKSMGKNDEQSSKQWGRGCEQVIHKTINANRQ